MTNEDGDVVNKRVRRRVREGERERVCNFAFDLFLANEMRVSSLPL